MENNEIERDLKKALEDLGNELSVNATICGPGETIVVTKDGLKIMSMEEAIKAVFITGDAKEKGIVKILRGPLEIKLNK